VRRLTEKLARPERLVLNKDVEAPMELYDNDFVAFDMWSWAQEGEASSRETYRKWLGLLGSESVVVEVEEVRVFQGGDTAEGAARCKID
jgi:ketosteroid isomerase-like protein